MASLNQFIVSGVVVLPAESRPFGDGRYIIKIRLGVEREKGTGDARQTVVEPISVTFFCSSDEANRLKAIEEGERMLVQGRIGGRATEGKNGGSFINVDLVGVSWEPLGGPVGTPSAKPPERPPAPPPKRAPLDFTQDDIPFLWFFPLLVVVESIGATWTL